MVWLLFDHCGFENVVPCVSFCLAIRGKTHTSESVWNRAECTQPLTPISNLLDTIRCSDCLMHEGYNVIFPAPSQCTRCCTFKPTCLVPVFRVSTKSAGGSCYSLATLARMLECYSCHFINLPPSPFNTQALPECAYRMPRAERAVPVWDLS